MFRKDPPEVFYISQAEPYAEIGSGHTSSEETIWELQEVDMSVVGSPMDNFSIHFTLMAWLEVGPYDARPFIFT